MKKKKCGKCLKDFPSLWKAKKKLPDGSISPAMCRDCSMKEATPIGNIKISNKTTQDGRTRKPINKQSDKEKKRQAQYKLVRTYYIAGHPNCEAQLTGCTLEATDIHHQKGKIGQLLIDMNFFIALCRSCHSYLELNPNEAKELGFSLNRLDK